MERVRTLCIVLCAALSGVAGLRITQLDVPKRAKEGDTVTMRCDYDLEGGSLMSVKWYHNNLEFYRFLQQGGGWAFPEDGMTIDHSMSDNHQVTLQNVSTTLSGMYKCEVSVDTPTPVETVMFVKQLNISKVGILKNVNIQLPQDVQERSNSAVLRCTYDLDGEQLREIKWYKNGNEFYSFNPTKAPAVVFTVLPGVKVNIPDSDDKQVTLKEITQATAGDYRCQVTADTTLPQSLSSEGHLNVSRAPDPHNLTVTVPENIYVGDEAATLTCTFNLEGQPLYNVKWFKDNEEFYRFTPKELPQAKSFPTPGFLVNLDGSNDTQLTLNDITIEATGIYRCEVTTEAPILYVMSGEQQLVVLSSTAETPTTTEKPNFFDKAVGWFKDKWHKIRD